MIILILLLGFILRLIRIDQSFWLDEASQAIMSSKSLSYIWFGREGDFHPPLSYIFSHFWLLISHNDIWLRMLPVLFGLGSIYVLYLIGQKLFNKNIAFWGAFLLSVSPYHIYYSQEFRMYSQAVFFALLSLYFFINLLKNKKFSNILLAFAISMLIYTHYFGIFLLFSLIIYVFLFERNSFIVITKVFLLAFLLYIPWIPQLFLQIRSGVLADQILPGWSNVLNVSFSKAIPLTFLKFSIGRINFENPILYLLVAFAVLVLFFTPIFYSFKKIKDKNISLVFFWLFLPIIFALLTSLFIPLYQPFRLLFVLPAYYLLIAFGLFQLEKFKKILFGLILIVSISGLVIYYATPKFLREDWKGAVSYINQNIKTGELVLFVWPQPFPPYEWYGGDKNNLSLTGEFPIKTEDVQLKLSGIKNSPKIYLIEYLQDLSDPNHETQREIEILGFKEGDKKDFSGVGFIQVYNK